MSNSMDNLGQAFEQAKTFVEEHPWQAAALAAYPIGGAAYFAGQLDKKEALTIAEFAAGGAVGLAGLIISDEKARADQPAGKAVGDGGIAKTVTKDQPAGVALDPKDPGVAHLADETKKALDGANKGGGLTASKAVSDQPAGTALDPKDSKVATKAVNSEPNGIALDPKDPKVATLVEAAKAAAQAQHH